MAAELEKQKELDDRLLQAETDEDRATMNRIVGDYGEKIQVFFSFLFFSFLSFLPLRYCLPSFPALPLRVADDCDNQKMAMEVLTPTWIL